MGIWVTVGFFEVQQARVNVAGSTYTNTFRCIPDSLPAPSGPGGGTYIHSRTPFGIAIPPGRLFDRLQIAMRKVELLPYIEVRPAGRASSDLLRLDRVRVVSVSPMATEMTRQVSIVVEV